MQGDVEITAESVFVVPDHVLSRSSAGEVVLLSLDDEAYYGLDDVGGRAWNLLATGRTFAQLVDALLSEYDVSREVLESDLRAVLLDLVANGLLLVIDGG